MISVLNVLNRRLNHPRFYFYSSLTKCSFSSYSITSNSSSTGSEKEALEIIDKTVKDNPLVLFMKGTVDRPQCGFSRTVVQILHQYPGLHKFTTVNVLADEFIRSAIKNYSNWPTIPQLYVRGSFVGGCDIIYDMYKTGALLELFEKEKVLEAVKDNEEVKK